MIYTDILQGNSDIKFTVEENGVRRSFDKAGKVTGVPMLETQPTKTAVVLPIVSILRTSSNVEIAYFDVEGKKSVVTTELEYSDCVSLLLGSAFCLVSGSFRSAEDITRFTQFIVVCKEETKFSDIQNLL